MKRWTIISAAAFACVLVPLARADVNVGDHPQLHFAGATGNQQVDLQSSGGKILIVDFWATWCEPCMQEAPHIVSINQKYAPLGVQMIGISLDQDRTAMQSVAKEKGFDWPQYFDGLVWDNKVAKQWGVNSIPQTFILSPQGEVLWRGHPSLIDPELEKAMQSHPPQLVDPQTVALASQTLDKVEAATNAQQYPDAIKLLGQFPPAARADPKIAKRADGDAQQLDAAAQAMLADADSLAVAGKYADAATKLKTLATSMGGTDNGKKATQSLAKLRANPAAASALAAVDREASASAALDTAQKLQAAKHDPQAYVSFKSVVKQFPGTTAADTAAAAIKAYDADLAFTKQRAASDAKDKDLKARSALSMAMNYLNAGKTDTAREKFQDLIAQYPGTEQADAAQNELAKMGN